MSNSPPTPSPLQITKQFHLAESTYLSALPGQRDFAHSLGPLLSPNFTSHQPPDLPWGGDWRGKDAYRRWSETMSGHFSCIQVLEPHFYVPAEGEGEGEVVGVKVEGEEAELRGSVVVQSRVRLVVRGSGREIVVPVVQVVVVERERGWVEGVRAFWWEGRGVAEGLRGRGRVDVMH